MSAEKEEINKLLEQVYHEIARSCRREFKNIGKVMRQRRKAMDFSIWQIGLKTESAFQDIELIEGGGCFDKAEFDFLHFFRLLDNIILLNDIYAFYEDNPSLLELDRVFKQQQEIYQREHAGG